MLRSPLILFSVITITLKYASSDHSADALTCSYDESRWAALYRLSIWSAIRWTEKSGLFWEILVWKCLNKDWLCDFYTFCNEVRKPPGPNVFRRLVLAVNNSKYCKGSYIERFCTQILWKTISKNMMHSKQILLITDCERSHVHK